MSRLVTLSLTLMACSYDALRIRMSGSIQSLIIIDHRRPLLTFLREHIGARLTLDMQ